MEKIRAAEKTHVYQKEDQSAMADRESGVVKWFNESKGYGFISRDSGGDIFVHYSALDGTGFRTLDEGARVEFTVTQGQKGPAAADVTKL